MPDSRQEIMNQFEGLIESTDRTEKELEPLRFHVFRTELLKQQLAAYEHGKLKMTPDERHDALARIFAETREVLHEAMALARTRGQLKDFRNSLRVHLKEVGTDYFSQVMGSLDTVAEFLEVNNLTRTVAPPEDDVAEALWQQCLDEHLRRHGAVPAPLKVTDLRIFQDTLASVIYKAWQDRLRSLNDPVSTLASTAAIYEGERKAHEKGLPSLRERLRGP